MSKSLELFHSRFKVGDRVRHFKWLYNTLEEASQFKYLYDIIAVGKDTEHQEDVVIYRSVANQQVWVRPVKDFCSLVDIAKYPDTQQFYRFEVLE